MIRYSVNTIPRTNWRKKMKKALFISVFLLVILTPVFAILSEGFEGTTFLPTGWSVENRGDTNTWVQSSTSHSGEHGVGIMPDSEVAHNDFLITPQLVPSSENHEISFWVKNADPLRPDQFNIYLSTTTPEPLSFNSVVAAYVTTYSDGWEYLSFDLTYYAGQKVYLAFNAISQNMGGLYLDDIVGPEIYDPSTPIYNTTQESVDFGTLVVTGSSSTPQTLTVFNIGGGSLEIVNAELVGDNPDQFQLTIPSFPVSLGYYEPTEVSVTYSPTEYATHTAILRITDGTLAEHDIPLSGSCVDATVHTFPYSFGFESSGNFTVENANDDYTSWAQCSTSPHSGLYCMSVDPNASMAMDDWLFTPPLEIQSGKAYLISFWYRVWNEDCPENLEVWAGTGANHSQMVTNLWTGHDLNNTTWKHASVFYSAGSPSPLIYIGFYGCSDTDMSNLYVDDLAITEVPAYGILAFIDPVTDFGTIPTNWETKTITNTVQNVGGSAVTVYGATISGTDSSHFIVGDRDDYPITLSTGDTLHVQVQFRPTSEGSKTADLSMNTGTRVESSLHLHGIGSATPSFLPLPITEGFEMVSIPELPPDWESQTVVQIGDYPPDWMSAAAPLYCPECNAHSGSQVMMFDSYDYYDGARARLILPSMDMTSTMNAHVTFWMYRDSDCSMCHDAVQVQIRQQFQNWTTLKTFMRADSVSAWHKYTIDLTPYAGTNIQLAFLGSSECGNSIYIDDFEVTESTPAPAITFISEVCDNPVGQPDGSGYIEIFNKAPYTCDLTGYEIRRGTDPSGEGTGFIPDSPEVAYIFPTGTMVPPLGTLVIGNGSNETNFKNAWGITTSLNYLSGDASLAITSGKAYDLISFSGRAGEIDASPEVAENSSIQQVNNDSWIPAGVIDGTPGELSGSQTLPVTMSAFTAIQTEADYVNIAWTTQSETDMRGYRILRNSSATMSNAVPICDLVNAVGAASAYTYSVTDIDVMMNSTYYYWVEYFDLFGHSGYYGPVSVTLTQNPGEGVPEPVLIDAVRSCYPNPFNPTTNIEFSVSNNGTPVTMTIYNVKGQVVHTMNPGVLNTGIHNVQWNGDDNNHHPCASGLYFVKVKIGDQSFVRQISMLK
jgi:hypothetical protein